MRAAASEVIRRMKGRPSGAGILRRQNATLGRTRINKKKLSAIFSRDGKYCGENKDRLAAEWD